MRNVQEFKNFLDVQDFGLQPKDAAYLNRLNLLNTVYMKVEEVDFLCDNDWDNFSTEILDRKYNQIIAKQVAIEQYHLSEQQRKLLESTLQKYGKIFDGKLGIFLDEKFHTDLVDDAKPVFKKAYHIPFQRESLFKNELQNIVANGVLEPCGQSAWAAPTFVVPKKDNRVKWVSDFRELNKLIKRKLFLMAKIWDIMNQRCEYKYFTKIDLSVFFYCFELDNESKELCTINTSYELFCYTRLAMEIKVLPNVAQDMITKIRLNVVACLDNCGIWTDTTFEHIWNLLAKFSNDW